MSLGLMMMDPTLASFYDSEQVALIGNIEKTLRAFKSPS